MYKQLPVLPKTYTFLIRYFYFVRFSICCHCSVYSWLWALLKLVAEPTTTTRSQSSKVSWTSATSDLTSTGNATGTSKRGSRATAASLRTFGSSVLGCRTTLSGLRRSTAEDWRSASILLTLESATAKATSQGPFKLLPNLCLFWLILLLGHFTKECFWRS